MTILYLLLDLLAAFLEAVEESSLWTLAGTAAICFYTGQAVVRDRPGAVAPGRTLGILVLAGYVLLAVIAGDELLLAALRGALAGAIVAGLAWLVLPPLKAAWQQAWNLLIARPVRVTTGTWKWCTDWKRRQRDEERRRRQDQEWQRTAPERERARQQADAERLAREHQLAAAQKRRVEARAACELLYNLYKADIGNRFSRKMLHEFMDKYMTDQDRVEDVERRGQELRNIIRQHQEAVNPTKRTMTIQELSEWYIQEKARIEHLPLDEEIRDEHRATLDARYMELTQRILQGIEP